MRSRTFGCEPDEGEENASKLGVAVVATFSDDYQAAIGHEGSFDHRAARTFRRHVRNGKRSVIHGVCSSGLSSFPRKLWR